MRPSGARGARRRGSAYAVVLVVCVLFLAAAVMLSGALSRGTPPTALADATLVADNAIAKGRARLLATWPAALDLAPGMGVALLTEDASTVTLTRLAGSATGRTFALRATGRASGVERTIELVLEVDDGGEPHAAPHLGAIVARGDVRLTGTIAVDGRDHAADGTLGGPSDSPGVVTPGVVQRLGAATIGGGDQAPSIAPVEDVAVDQATTLWTEADPTDGADDDGDGLVDEDGFPATAEAVLGIGGGATLRARAERDGTLFASVAALEAWCAARTPFERGGKVLYVEVPPASDAGALHLPDTAPLDASGLPRLPVPRPSVVVVAAAGGTRDAQVGPVHVDGAGFQGVFVAEGLHHVNGAGRITGAVVVTGSTIPAWLGNGSVEVAFSSAVLDDLPDCDPGPPRLATRVWRVVR